jgi:hypothetical protein
LPEYMQEVVRQDSHEQPGLVRCESVATGLVSAQCVLSRLLPVLYVATAIIQLAHIPGRDPGIGHNKSDPREEIPIVPSDLGHHSTLPVPRLSLVPKINQPDLNPSLGRSPHGTGQ